MDPECKIEELGYSFLSKVQKKKKERKPHCKKLEKRGALLYSAIVGLPVNFLIINCSVVVDQ